MAFAYFILIVIIIFIIIYIIIIIRGLKWGFLGVVVGFYSLGLGVVLVGLLSFRVLLPCNHLGIVL